MKSLDVITIGRSSVDLYGIQIGGRLEDMRSFRKYVGGSPTNMAVGMARLGMKVALITRVGDEHMGRFIVERLAAEGVDTRGIKTDPERLTALVILGIRDEEQFPLVFYRENCADMALSDRDIDAEFIGDARCVVVTGTHLSNPRTEAAVLKALQLARAADARTALDIDYRPNLWGLAGHGAGESRFIESEAVTAKLQATLGGFDLIVGTEDEFHIAGGSNDTLQAVQNIRQLTSAILVCKRGPGGAVVFQGDIPDDLDEAPSGPAFPIEVFNVLGAGDGFMSGLLKGWLRNDDWPTTLEYANACGALAVSRHGCAPAYPTWDELQFFLERGIRNRALRKDAALEHIHWTTNRTGEWENLRILSFDDSKVLEGMAAELGADQARIRRYKELCLEALLAAGEGRSENGIVCDSGTGRSALFKAAGSGIWIARPLELAGAALAPRDIGSMLAEWPAEHVVCASWMCSDGNGSSMGQVQESTLLRVFEAARSNDLELLVAIDASPDRAINHDTAVTIIQRVYDLGIYPDWWMVRPLESREAWAHVCGAVARNDPQTRGILMQGADMTAEELEIAFRDAGPFDLVKGFCASGAIIAKPMRNWFNGTSGDKEAVSEMEAAYRSLCAAWDQVWVRRFRTLARP
jgi:5-dehydro-2-deoxygluconokinase